MPRGYLVAGNPNDAFWISSGYAFHYGFLRLENQPCGKRIEASYQPYTRAPIMEYLRAFGGYDHLHLCASPYNVGVNVKSQVA